MPGYLFCLTTSKSGVTNSPFSSSTAEARLMFYFEEMQADNGVKVSCVQVEYQ